MIRNIVFDMGMVLLDYNPLLPCIRHCGDAGVAATVNKAIFGDPSWGPMIDGGVLSEAEFLTEAQKRLPTPELKALAAEVMTDWWLDALYPKSGMDRLILKLKEQGYGLYILTNCGHRFHDFSYKIPHFEAFDGVLVSAEHRMLKPNADIFEKLCEMFDLKAEECLFVDDLEKNTNGAKAVGMDGYCFLDGDVARLTAYIDQLN